jgi:hypothetical protein
MAQQMRSQLMARYGQRLDDAVRAHAQDETSLGGFTRLPGGITNGIAQLQGVKFDTYKTGKTKGEWYCQFEAVVVSPEEVVTPSGPVRVAGVQFRKNMAVCDTAKQDGTQVPLEDNIAAVLNQMRLLADPPGTPIDQSFTSGAGGEDLERLGEILAETAPFFNFSTRETPARDNFPARTWEDWGAMVQHTQEPQQGVSVQGQPAPTGAPAACRTRPAGRAARPGTAPSGVAAATPARCARPDPARNPGDPPRNPATGRCAPAGPAGRPARTRPSEGPTGVPCTIRGSRGPQGAAAGPAAPATAGAGSGGDGLR